MTATARTTAASFVSDAIDAVVRHVRSARARRARRIALVTLMDMDASQLDDLGLNLQDVAEALHSPSSAAAVLEARRTRRAAAWTHKPAAIAA
jgi:tRNA A37 threonylcarbamoyladenosine dehydratase